MPAFVLPIEHSDYDDLTPLPPSVYKKRALLIGIQNYASTDAESSDEQLKGPHVDVLNMRQLLIDCYDYKPDDITVIIDDCDPEHTQPTEVNLIQSMKDLVAGARSGDQFYLHFSGHGTQLDDDNGDEEDGLDECILTCDNKTIRDDMMYQLLVAPLPVGSSFVSVFDSCHSGTMLDLMHYRCNQVYVPWVNKGVRRTAFRWNIVTRQETQFLGNWDAVQVPLIQVSEEPVVAKEPAVAEESLVVIGTLAPLNLNVCRSAQQPSLSITTHISTSNWTGSSDAPLKYQEVSPNPIYCTGFCHEETADDDKPKADVISISATKDEQLSWENSDGSSMTEALIKVLRKDPHASLKHVLTSVSHELHTFYMDLHKKSRVYKDKIYNTNIRRKIKGKGPCKTRTVEMNNFQDPQVSSHRPLDMNRPFPL